MHSDPSNERSMLAKLFLSRDEPRLRLGWRIAGQVAIFFAGLFVFTIPFSLLLLLPEAWLRVFTGDLLTNLFLLIGAPAQFLAGVTSVYLARRFLDRRSFTSLGLLPDRHALPDLLVGITLPALMLGLIYLIQWSLGWLEVEGLAWDRLNLLDVAWQILFLLLVFIAVGFYEELTFRGYWLQNMNESLGLAWGTLLSSAAFALSHLGNPGITARALAGLLIAGVFFAFCYLRTRTLWLPIGIHIGWNFFEGPVYGFQVSGIQAFRLIEQTVLGPDLWTGGPFGPEAGLLLLPALALGSLLILLYTRGRSGGPA